MRVLVWLTKACALLFGLGLLSLVLGGANELFGLGIWTDDYPALGEAPEGGVDTEPAALVSS